MPLRSKDLDEIKIQELVGSLQTYELGLPSHKSRKLLAFKTINERNGESSNEDYVEKDVAYLAKNFCKFLKMKNNGNSFGKVDFHPSRLTRNTSRRRTQKIYHHPKALFAMNAMGMGI